MFASDFDNIYGTARYSSAFGKCMDAIGRRCIYLDILFIYYSFIKLDWIPLVRRHSCALALLQRV